MSERAPSLHDQRLQALLAVLADIGAKCVVDLSCDESKQLKLLQSEKQFETIPGTTKHGHDEINGERWYLKCIIGTEARSLPRHINVEQRALAIVLPVQWKGTECILS